MYHGPRDGLVEWFARLGYGYDPALHGVVSDWALDLVACGSHKPARFYGPKTITTREQVAAASARFVEEWMAARGLDRAAAAPEQARALAAAAAALPGGGRSEGGAGGALRAFASAARAHAGRLMHPRSALQQQQHQNHQQQQQQQQQAGVATRSKRLGGESGGGAYNFGQQQQHHHHHLSHQRYPPHHQQRFSGASSDADGFATPLGGASAGGCTDVADADALVAAEPGSTWRQQYSNILRREFVMITRNPADVAGRTLTFAWVAAFSGLFYYGLPETGAGPRLRFNMLLNIIAFFCLMPYISMSLYTAGAPPRCAALHTLVLGKQGGKHVCRWPVCVLPPTQHRQPTHAPLSLSLSLTHPHTTPTHPTTTLETKQTSASTSPTSAPSSSRRAPTTPPR